MRYIDRIAKGPFLGMVALGCALTSCAGSGEAKKTVAATASATALPTATATTPATSSPMTAPTSRVGGYLTRETMPNSARLLPPPPAMDSAAFAADQQIYRSTRALRDTPRWALAQQDAVLRFPDVAGTFSCAIEAPISESVTPKLYALLRRAQADTGASTGLAKAKYMRRRPFAELKEQSCTPQDESRLANDGSYPSGHTAIGWGLALVLTEVVPERANEILARGYAFGQSRVVCGVHWQSDVNEGRVMASSAVARMHTSPEFVADVAAARAEVDTVRQQKLAPSRDCSVEAAALAIPVK